MFTDTRIATRRYSVIVCAALAAAALAGPVDAGSVTIGGAQNNNVVGGSATLAPGVGGAVKKNTKGTVVDATGLGTKVVPGAVKPVIPDAGVAVIPKPPQPDAAACKQYASHATQASTQAKQLNCHGLTGPRWSGNYNAHFNWCMAGIPQNVLLAEMQARIVGLAACTTNTKK